MSTGIRNPIDWRVLEDALQEWAHDSSGVDILWANQDISQVPYPFGILNVIAGPTTVGGEPETRCKVIDGKNILQKISEHEFTLSVQFTVGPPDNMNPEMHSRALMSRAKAALGLPEFRDKLHAVGLAIIEILSIQNLDLTVADIWVSRTGMDVRFGLTMCTQQEIEVIEKVEVSGEVSRAPGDPAPIDVPEFTIGG